MTEINIIFFLLFFLFSFFLFVREEKEKKPRFRCVEKFHFGDLLQIPYREGHMNRTNNGGEEDINFYGKLIYDTLFPNPLIQVILDYSPS